MHEGVGNSLFQLGKGEGKGEGEGGRGRKEARGGGGGGPKRASRGKNGKSALKINAAENFDVTGRNSSGEGDILSEHGGNLRAGAEK